MSGDIKVYGYEFSDLEDYQEAHLRDVVDESFDHVFQEEGFMSEQEFEGDAELIEFSPDADSDDQAELPDRAGARLYIEHIGTRIRLYDSEDVISEEFRGLKSAAHSISYI